MTNSSNHVYSGSSTQEKMTKQFSAVEIRGGCKSYGKGKKKVWAMDHLDMTVPQGSIYGLLGPSGCGKTTLLGSLVNTMKLDSGTVSICGYQPGSAEAAVPGHRVGYMPQELALFRDFKIEETFVYFGRIHGMTREKIQEREDFLIQFLDLPNSNRIISQLSGGQQRRVSFAVALLHEPELLILDEPTVGVDPLLRTNIWKHLVKVSQDTHATIIITTHYIEEARQATRVGLMRRGRLLAEASPKSLTEYFRIFSLEDVFLRLCLKDGDLEVDSAKDNQAYKSTEVNLEMSQRKVSENYWSEDLETRKDSQNKNVMLQEKNVMEHLNSPWTRTSKEETYFSTGRFKALLGKAFTNLLRNISFLLMSFLLPPIQTTLFCLTIGGIPQNLKMGVSNLDLGSDINIGNLNITKHIEISDMYLEKLNQEVIKQVPYSSLEEGYDAVEKGITWGLLYFEPDYTNAILSINDTAMYPTDTGRIKVYMDTTNQQIYYTLLMQILRPVQMGFSMFQNQTNLPMPILFEDPVYGTTDPTFTEFMAPGIILTMTYFMALGLTAIAFIIEKSEGLYARSCVAGVNNLEIILSHLVAQLAVMIIQIFLILLFMFVVFNIPCLGSIIWVILLSLLQGLCGMAFGMLISVSFDDILTAMMATMGVFYPVLLLSGIVWPVEGMPTVLRYIAYLLPQTYACESLRAIMFKGWDITHFDVYFGYIITILWFIFYLAMSGLMLKIRKHM